MIWPVLAAGSAAVGLNYQAAKELDGSGPGRRLPPFWPAFVLGAVTGLWIGVSFSPNISSAFGFLEKWFGTPPQPITEDDTSMSEGEDEKSRRKRKARKQ